MSALFLYQLAKSPHTITIQNRDIVAPIFGSVDFDEDFSNVVDVKSIIDTTRGVTLFDGVGTDRVITHIFKIAHITGVTAESWILFNGRRFDIIDVENCCEKDEILLLRSTERGTGEPAKI